MRAFITGLQFLTTIRLWTESEWTPEGFGRSCTLFSLGGGTYRLSDGWRSSIAECLVTSSFAGSLASPFAVCYSPEDCTVTALWIAWTVCFQGAHQNEC